MSQCALRSERASSARGILDRLGERALIRPSPRATVAVSTAIVIRVLSAAVASTKPSSILDGNGNETFCSPILLNTRMSL